MNPAQKWLLDHECDDLMINDEPLTGHGRWIYTSDAMMEFAQQREEEDYKTQLSIDNEHDSRID